MGLAGLRAGDLTVVFGRGFAIFRPEIVSFLGSFLREPAFPEELDRFRLPNVVVFFFDVDTLTFLTLLGVLTFFDFVFVVWTIVDLTIFPFLICALTFFLETLVIRPCTTRLTFEVIVFPFLTVSGLGGAGIAFFLPIKPRQVSAPHMHFCSLAPSNQEKL